MSSYEVGPQPVEVDGQLVLYGDGRTKQSFLESTNINKILEKAQRVGSLSHLVKYGAVYGDFSDIPDLLEARRRLDAGEKVYRDLPSELRSEFPDQFKFFEFVNNPENKDRLQEVLPMLAKPGRQRPDVRRTAASEQNPAVDSGPPSAPPAEPSAASGPPASSTT